MRKMITVNRKANHEYFLTDRYEAGLVLQVRKSNPSVKEVYS